MLKKESITRTMTTLINENNQFKNDVFSLVDENYKKDDQKTLIEKILYLVCSDENFQDSLYYLIDNIKYDNLLQKNRLSGDAYQLMYDFTIYKAQSNHQYSCYMDCF